MTMDFKWYADLMFSFHRVNFNLFDIHARPDLEVHENLSVRRLEEQDVDKLMEFHDIHIVKWNGCGSFVNNYYPNNSSYLCSDK